jgi:hypothetical protein
MSLRNKTETHGVSCIYCKRDFGIEITVPEPVTLSFGSIIEKDPRVIEYEEHAVPGVCPHCHGRAMYRYHAWMY